jgi:hypothetical protein
MVVPTATCAGINRHIVGKQRAAKRNDAALYSFRGDDLQLIFFRIFYFRNAKRYVAHSRLLQLVSPREFHAFVSFPPVYASLDTSRLNEVSFLMTLHFEEIKGTCKICIVNAFGNV